MIELYEYPPTRSQRARWALEELGLEYTRRVVDLPAGEQDSDAYRAIQPLGVVPALRTEAYTIFESVAIVLQLIEEHPEKRLAPAVGTPQRAAYYQWCVFACAELDPPLMMFFDNSMRPVEYLRPPATKHDAGLAARGRHDFGVRAEILSRVLGDRDFMLGAEFTGADILVGHSCFMASLMGLIDDYPVLVAYHARLAERPAHRRAYDG